MVDIPPAGNTPAGAIRESIMRLEIEQATDATERAALERTLHDVLADVRSAVEDWGAMRGAVAAAQAGLTAHPPAAAPELLPEARSFLSWLLDDYFVFLGSRQYRFAAQEGDIVRGSGRGILRDESRSVFEGLRRFVDLPAYTRAFLLAPRIIEVSRSTERSRIVRAAPTDAIAVKLFDQRGQPVGLQLFVGLFTWHAHRVNPQTVPLLAGKVEGVLRRSGAPLGSHDRRTLVHIIESLPRDELFQIEEDQLLTMALGVRDLTERPRVGLFIRPDPFGRFYSCFVFVPRDRYRTELRQRFVSILTSALDARLETFHVALDDQPLARVTFFLRTGPETARRNRRRRDRTAFGRDSAQLVGWAARGADRGEGRRLGRCDIRPLSPRFPGGLPRPVLGADGARRHRARGAGRRQARRSRLPSRRRRTDRRII